MSPRDAEIAEIDAFLAREKTLVGPLPIWNQGSRRGEVEAVWPVADADGISIANLRFRCSKSHLAYPSMSMIMRGQPIWRVDLVPPDEWKPNPPWAEGLGLPPVITGSHGHEWPDNRDHVSRIPVGPWDLPARRPLQPQIRRLTHALPAFAERINLVLTHEQRGFDVPPQSELF
jgi:hypothetical protein